MILAPKFFISVQNGTLKMACHFVARTPCQNFGIKILAKSPKWHLRKWHAKVWQVDEQTPRNGAWSVSQGRRGPSNGVSKMNLFMAGGHNF